MIYLKQIQVVRRAACWHGNGAIEQHTWRFALDIHFGMETLKETQKTSIKKKKKNLVMFRLPQIGTSDDFTSDFGLPNTHLTTCAGHGIWSPGMISCLKAW